MGRAVSLFVPSGKGARSTRDVVGQLVLGQLEADQQLERRARDGRTHLGFGQRVDRAEATLPDDIRDRITRKRKPGEIEAAVDPLTEPDVRAAISRATFELLVGFQLTQDQLAYNVTR